MIFKRIFLVKRVFLTAFLFSIFILLFAIFLAGCEKKKEGPLPVGGGVSSSPEELKRAFRERIKNYQRFNKLEEAKQKIGYEFRFPKKEPGTLLGIFVSSDREEVVALFDDYPPFGVYLVVRNKVKKPDYKYEVEEARSGAKKGRMLAFTLPKLVSIVGHEGIAEEPTIQGGAKKFPVGGFVKWWDEGKEYFLFGKADGRTKPTSVKELLEIANSMY